MSKTQPLQQQSLLDTDTPAKPAEKAVAMPLPPERPPEPQPTIAQSLEFFLSRGR